jgi:hypothetical protein
VTCAPDAVNWEGLASALAHVESVLRQAGDDVAEDIQRLKDDIETGEREGVLARITSGDMWGHMGSFFDRLPADPDLHREFRRAQIRLADLLEGTGVARPDVADVAAVLRRWEADGL